MVLTRGGTHMPKIGKRIVDASEPKRRRYYVWDVELKGFGLLILPIMPETKGKPLPE